MRNFNLDDTIAAISTPIGQAGIGIVRLSGKKSLSIADKIFLGKDGLKPSKFKTYTTHYGWIIDRNQPAPAKRSGPGKPEYRNQKKDKRQIIDEVILTVMHSPRSYTKEDIVEINCHSGIVPLKKILDLVLSQGARLAQPGEFTKRAFLNGRIDLVQAESVLDIIRARTEASLRIGFNQLKGDLSKKIHDLRSQLLDIIAHLETLIDFPEEDIESTQSKDLLKSIEQAEKMLNKLLSSFQYGKILREGISVVICGKPNVGKSSLLNALLGEDRSIVTPIPGTTRDTIEEVINLEGIPLKIVDTAGIIEPKDLIEKEAIKRSQMYLSSADLALLVFDGSQKLNKDDQILINKTKDKQIIAVINKIDLKQHIDISKLKNLFKNIVRISALKNKGIGDLRKQITKKVWGGDIISTDEVLVSNVRHEDALRRAAAFLLEAKDIIKSNNSLELVSHCLRESVNCLGEITGETIGEDILDRIFGEFCIGK